MPSHSVGNWPQNGRRMHIVDGHLSLEPHRVYWPDEMNDLVVEGMNAILDETIIDASDLKHQLQQAEESVIHNEENVSMLEGEKSDLSERLREAEQERVSLRSMLEVANITIDKLTGAAAE